MNARLALATLTGIFFSATVLSAPPPTAMATFDNIPVSTLTAAPLKSEQVKQAILTAAVKRKWIAQESGPNTIVAAILVRGQHQVTVDISYNEREFSVKYKSSENLNYKLTPKGPRIHSKYNQWVQALVAAIRTEILPLK